MGADIHIYMQRYHQGLWVPVDPPDPMDPEPDYGSREDDVNFGRYFHKSELQQLSEAAVPLLERVPEHHEEWFFCRDYRAFGYIAGVRGGPPVVEPRGWPPDLGEFQEDLENWAHTPTWFNGEEFDELVEERDELNHDSRWVGLRNAMLNIAERYNITPADVRMIICFDS